MASDARTSLPDDIVRKFITACHILHYHGVLDAYGHLSIRHTSQPDVFVMARQIPPALVSSSKDLIDYRVSDAMPVHSSLTDGYVERFIHSEIYKKYTEIHAVIHSHADSVIPYTMSGVALQPCFHMAGFLGTSTPVFDVAELYKPDDIQDLLVRNTRLGEALASHFTESKEEARGVDHAVVLMRGHGMSVAAPDIETCVLRSIYTMKNASIQSTVIIQSAAWRSGNAAPTPRYLNREEADAAAVMTRWSSGRPWKLWVREVEKSGLYSNEA